MSFVEDKEPKPAPAAAIFNRNALNLPNLITTIRLVLSFVLFAMIYASEMWLAAAGLFVLAAGTDWLDGYLARRFNQVTVLGRILDPFVDKIIIIGSFVFLLAKGAETGVNAWMVVIIVGREMYVTSLRAICEQSGRDFSAALIGKLKMVLQCVAVVVTLLSLNATFSTPTFLIVRDVLLWGTVLVTAYSGIDYTVRAARILSEPT